MSAALAHLSVSAQSHSAVLANRQWKLAGASLTSAHAAVHAFAAAAAGGLEQGGYSAGGLQQESVREEAAGEGEPAAPLPEPAAPLPEPAAAGANASERRRANTVDLTSAALPPAVAGPKVRRRTDTSRLYLPYISPTSPLHLPHISPTPQVRRRSRSMGELFARPTLVEAKQRLADEQRRAG